MFRQLDPAGERRASDELEEVARTVGGPFIVRKDPEYGVYEQVVEFAVAAEGRFAVRVEGRPGFDPILPALRQQVEIAPRLFVEFVGDAAGKGRPVFGSFAPRAAGVGIPGDAKAALAVAAGDGLTGAGMGVSLLVKPDLYAAEVPDAAGQGGPAAAVGLVGGAAAAMIGAGAPAGQLLPSTGMRPGGWLVIPESWLQYVPPRALRPPPR